ncbi:4'-phosphopantetheinyl transferase superfamily protein [Bacillus sp. FJAT-29790]|uniref:4'-phosphopantetheinyl transferase family protein n=1 Tax=Bacillus sp. FJAT-29790 TaxID=1895002 RepID=UPI001C24278E|nr:4'-phosphopantetheinyl transferase superfamily protein [Bacillus sp. FJAT-29790]MBU8881310.1 4'-phosphopantetheinyl transferase superfamily protein [Bacillus sp. FJAT-29790]
MDGKTRVCCIKVSYDKEVYRNLYDLTTHEEKLYLNRYRNENNRYDSLLGLIAVKVLAKVSLLQSLCHTTNGQPYLKGYNGRISIAHSNGWVITSVSSYKIGVDIEKKLYSMDKELFLSKKELTAFRGKWNTDILTVIWTLKEAYTKSQGVGFFTDPTNITCQLEDGYWKIDDCAMHTQTQILPDNMTLSVVSESKEVDIRVISEERLLQQLNILMYD